MRIFLIRHGRTEWNNTHRIQGHTDIALTDKAKEQLKSLAIAKSWAQSWHSAIWYTSPLRRARQTAELLFYGQIEIDPLLSEMRWGDFEGFTLEEIDHAIATLPLQPDRGLHFRPPNGETPDEVKQRLKQWIAKVYAPNTMKVAVTHKGVIRTALSEATGWDMQEKFSVKINWSLPLAFEWHPGERLKLVQINCDWNDTSLFNTLHQ